MAYQNYSHTAEIMKATLPYFDPRTRLRVEFMSKILDVMGGLNIFGRESMVACGYEKITVDVEGLLNGIRPICDSRERELLDRILNIFNMKKTFEMYNNVMNTMKTMQEFGGFPFGNSENKDDTDTVTGNFTSSNYDSIFRAFSEYSKDHKDTEDENINSASTDNSASTERPKGGFAPNDTMLEMLKSMVPAEQQGTFENLRMLLNTMSYDDNSNPDDSKENSNG